MRAVQGTVGGGVVEALAIEADDVGRTAEVLAVTAPAVAVAGRGRAAVEAGLRAHVGSDLVVAVQAQAALRLAMEGLVALAALRLDVRVRGCDRPRHDQALERAGRGRSSQTEQHHGGREAAHQ
jgi:hypothetical protein